MRMSEYWKGVREKALSDNADKIEKFERLVILREGTPEKPCVRIWRGTQGRPFANFIFKSAESREKYINDQKTNETSSVEYRQKSKMAQRSKSIQRLAMSKVGDILYDSWGYDQTNIDWYQIVRKTGSMFVVRPIKNTYKETGFMCGNELPLKDQFCADGKEELVSPTKYSMWEGRPVGSSSYA